MKLEPRAFGSLGVGAVFWLLPDGSFPYMKISETDSLRFENGVLNGGSRLVQRENVIVYIQ